MSNKPHKDDDLFGLSCPACGEKLPYVPATTNANKSVRVWCRLCRSCGLVVVDTGVFSREVIAPVDARS